MSLSEIKAGEQQEKMSDIANLIKNPSGINHNFETEKVNADTPPDGMIDVPMKDMPKETPETSTLERYDPDTSPDGMIDIPMKDMKKELSGASPSEISDSDSDVPPDDSVDLPKDADEQNDDSPKDSVSASDEISGDQKGDLENSGNQNSSTKADEVEDHSDINEKSSFQKDFEEANELSDEQVQDICQKTGWSEDKVRTYCRIKDDGTILYKTTRSDLEGKTADCGVTYVRKTIEINGVKIDGVFPVFDSAFDTKLDPEDYQNPQYAKICNRKLKEAVENDPSLAEKFTPEQLQDIKEGRTPRGYVWHHSEEPGKMQLVKRADHDRTIGGAAHTGGNALWGPDSSADNNEGKHF